MTENSNDRPDAERSPEELHQQRGRLALWSVMQQSLRTADEAEAAQAALDPDPERTAQLRTIFAEYERERIIERIRKGREAKKQAKKEASK